MPELPEVQTVVNSIVKPLSGRKIISIRAHWPKVFDNFHPDTLFKKQSQLKIITVFRRAKFIIIQLEDSILAVHLRMTGKLYISEETFLPKHTSALIELDKKINLIFEDVRKFGRIYF